MTELIDSSSCERSKTIWSCSSWISSRLMLRLSSVSHESQSSMFTSELEFDISNILPFSTGSRAHFVGVHPLTVGQSLYLQFSNGSGSSLSSIDESLSEQEESSPWFLLLHLFTIGLAISSSSGNSPDLHVWVASLYQGFSRPELGPGFSSSSSSSEELTGRSA